MQDLIYKRGQSGITKASVTLVFNNTDPAQSPIGYADQPQITVTRQVIVGGKHKYLVNGHNAPAKVVENLFQSVQLNVNNPHFLIMQGQITKVLNMKAPETLALIEEAAGTRMFEDRRGKALSTIEKKDRKVEEIAELLAEVIEPKLAALRAERTQYLEYKRAEADIDRLRKVMVAFDFYTKTHELHTLQENDEALRASLGEFEAEAAALVAKIAHLTTALKGLRKERDARHAETAVQLKSLEEAERGATHDATRLSAQIELKREQLKGQAGESEKTARSLRRDRTALDAARTETARQAQVVAQTRAAHEQQTGKVRQTEDLVQSLMTGVSVADDGTGATGFTRLVEDLKAQLGETRRKTQTAELRIAAISEEVASIQPQLQRTQASSRDLQTRLQAAQSRVRALEDRQQAQAAALTAEQIAGLERERARLERVVAEERAKMDRLRGLVASVSFQYRDPEPGFDRSLVKGSIAELIELAPEAAERYGTALEIAAGGRLHHVVVDDDAVAKTLLDRPGVLSRRTTFVPLNRIQPRTLPAEREAAAAALAPGRVRSALGLVSSADPAVQPALRFVFGSTLVCEDDRAATACAFDPTVAARAVTVAGDLYEPSGTLTGGSRPGSAGSSIVEAVAKFRAAQTQLVQAETLLAGVRGRLDQEAVSQLANDLQLAEAETAMLRRQFEQGAFGQLVSRLEGLEGEKRGLERALEELQVLKTSLQEQLQQAERDAQELQQNRAAKLKGLQADLKGAETLLAKEEQRLAGAEQKMQALSAECERLEAQCARMEAGLQGGQQSRQDLLRELGELEISLVDAENRAASLTAQLELLRTQTAQMDAELDAAETEKRRAVEYHDRLQIPISKVRSDCEKLAGEIERFQGHLQATLKAHPWIADVETSFGRADGHFCFEALDMAESRRQLKALEERQGQLKRKINPHVLDMIDRIELKEASLRKMLATIHHDKRKIESTISALDDFKAETLRRTWTRVNADFGAVLAELLPGAFCRLAPVTAEGLEVEDVAAGATAGLEIRVRLGAVWKESLVELSGGQRSLTALALILALLQCRPAPMYILDEVDAALDLSHTQNIGNLLKQRFRGSQFIVVSLKEGMFTNANVLFRTRFRDGISSVERIVQAGLEPKRAGSHNGSQPGKRAVIKTTRGKGDAVVNA
jgi:structural maintenance of chromosome 2